jgi:hypothetical protein
MDLRYSVNSLDTVTPDYDFVIQLKNSESIAFHFWLKPTNETGMFTNVRSTAIGYTVSKESTGLLPRGSSFFCSFK